MVKFEQTIGRVVLDHQQEEEKKLPFKIFTLNTLFNFLLTNGKTQPPIAQTNLFQKYLFFAKNIIFFTRYIYLYIKRKKKR